MSATSKHLTPYHMRGLQIHDYNLVTFIEHLMRTRVKFQTPDDTNIEMTKSQIEEYVPE